MLTAPDHRSSTLLGKSLLRGPGQTPRALSHLCHLLNTLPASPSRHQRLPLWHEASSAAQVLPHQRPWGQHSDSWPLSSPACAPPGTT